MNRSLDQLMQESGTHTTQLEMADPRPDSVPTEMPQLANPNAAQVQQQIWNALNELKASVDLLVE